MKYRYVLPIAAFALVLSGAWVAGFDFDERGFKALMVMIYAIVLPLPAHLIGKQLDGA